MDRALEALRRLLVDANAGGQAKVDALVALSQRTLFVPTWGPTPEAGFRTLIRSGDESALPVFSAQADLERAADQLGWRGSDGTVSFKEAGARQALRFVVAQNLTYLVVDMGAPHSLEATRSEIEPLVSPSAGRDSGPFAAVGRVTSSMLEAVTPAPGTVSTPEKPERSAVAPAPGSYGAATKVPSTPPSSPPLVSATSNLTASTGGTPTATFGSGTSVQIVPLAEEPTDALLDAISDTLRGYPEVEWAAFCAASRGPAEARPTVGLRVDTSFRARLNELITGVRGAAEGGGATVDVLLLDDAAVMRAARSQGIVFYPWRRRSAVPGT